MILFRTEASQTIGFGHLSRCLTLAHAFQEQGMRCVLAISRASSAAARALDPKVDVRLLEVEAGGVEDAAQTAALAAATGGHGVVADGYDFRASWIDLLRERGVRCAYVDDYATGRYECDAVLNHNVFAEGLVLDAPPACVQLLGPSYALVRPSFRSARARRLAGRVAAVPERVVVTLGGSDPTGTTLAITRWLSDADASTQPPLHVRIVLGPAFHAVEKAHAIASGARRHRVEIATNVRDLASLFEWADLVVTAAGVTCLEVACVGVPMLVVCLADNQRRTAQGVADKGMAESLGEHSALDAARFFGAIEGLRSRADARTAMVDAQRTRVDGAGPERAAARLSAAFDHERGQN